MLLLFFAMTEVEEKEDLAAYNFPSAVADLLNVIWDDMLVCLISPGCFMLTRKTYVEVMDLGEGYWRTGKDSAYYRGVTTKITCKGHTDLLPFSVVHSKASAVADDWFAPGFRPRDEDTSEAMWSAVADDIKDRGSRFLLGYFGSATEFLPDFLSASGAEIGDNVFAPWFYHKSEDDESKCPVPFPMYVFLYGPHSRYKYPNIGDLPDWDSMKKIPHTDVDMPVDPVSGKELIKKLDAHGYHAWSARLHGAPAVAGEDAVAFPWFHIEALLNQFPHFPSKPRDGAFMPWAVNSWDTKGEKLGLVKMKQQATPWGGKFDSPPALDLDGIPVCLDTVGQHRAWQNCYPGSVSMILLVGTAVPGVQRRAIGKAARSGGQPIPRHQPSEIKRRIYTHAQRSRPTPLAPMDQLVRRRGD